MSELTHPSDSAAATSVNGLLGNKLVGPTLGLCALAATAHSLGATWLASPVLGLPAGLWLIGMGLGSPRAVRAAKRMAQTQAAARAATARSPLSVATSRAWPTHGVAKKAVETVADALGSAADWAENFDRIGVDRLAEWHDRLAWSSRPLRIGVALDEARRVAIVNAPGVVECEWVSLAVDAAAGDAQDLMRRNRLDAMVHDGGSGLAVITPEASDREASWYDWSEHRPLSYAGVFPIYLDCARVSLTGLAVKFERDAAVARALTETAAVLSRSAHRLTLADRVSGRRPIDDGRMSEGSRGSFSREPSEACLKDLLFRVQSFDLMAVPTPAQRAAARVVSAWLATRPMAEDVEADIASRRRGIEAAAQIAGDEPEVMLRLAAVRFAAMDDDAGYDALWRADRILRDRQTLPGIDQAVFLQAELDLGPYGPMTLGRAAAGICLLCATTPVDRIPYVRDDLIDDMRYSGWLVGRDQERAMLIEVFRRLERIRRSERMGLPSAQAA